jgi:glycosyltransferase involved in cell wall biosynthesis
MQINQNAFKTSKTTKQAQRPKSILIFGEINTSGTLAELEMLKLTASLIAAGHNIETVTPTANPMSRNIVNFRTPHKFNQTTQFLTRYDHVIIFLETLTSPKFRSTNAWAKAKERMRILKFVHQVQNAGRKVTLIGSKMQRLATFKLAQETTFLNCEYANAASQAFAMISGHKLRPLDLQAAQNTVIEHASFRNSDGKFTALKLQRYLTATQNNDDALATLIAFATQPNLYQTSLIKQLKKHPDSTNSVVSQSLPPYPVLDMAMDSDNTEKIPSYAAHLLNVFHRNHSFDLNTVSGRSDAMEWYHTSAREKLSEFWVPQSKPKTEASMSEPHPPMLDQIQQFLDDPRVEPNQSFELNRLLHLRRYSYGPTAMAILLALLCRIQLSSKDRMNPWKSKQITSWFDGVSCTIAPGLRGFQNTKIQNPIQRPSAQVIGLPQQETGLGANMRMSLQVFEKIGLNLQSRDLDTDRTLNITTSAPIRVKRNFALHHINAERVPMNIMTPQFAHRNDVYHIGYFLWETSEIPNAHRLGTSMINEVWTPTEFVADLYRNAGAEQVTMVGKALPELEYLSKLETISRPDNNHYTVFSGFDFHSSVERKNPISVVHAFQRAFPKRVYPDHRLILKTTPNTVNHWGDPMNQMGQIRNIAIRDSRISIIEKMLPLEYLFRLMARADCVVSAHRGEGFGYLPAYALGLSKPTIVTNWGGSTDFCNTKTAFPVGFNMVDVPHGHAIYDADNAQWANIDLNDLTQKMLDVFDDYATAKSRAIAGQSFVREKYSLDRLSKTYHTRLSQIGLI